MTTAGRQARGGGRMLVLEMRPGWMRATECRGTNGGAVAGGSAAGELACDPFGSDAEAAGTEIRLMLEQAGIKPGAAAVAVPMAWAMMHAFEAPELGEEDFADLVALEAERAFPLPPEDMVVSHARCRREGAADLVIVAAMPVAKVEALERVLRAAKVSPSLIVPGCAIGAEEAASIRLVAEGTDLVLRVAGPEGLLALRILCRIEPGAGIEDDAVRADVLRELRGVLRSLPEDFAAGNRRLVLAAPQETAARLAGQLGEVAERLGLPLDVEAPGQADTALALHRSLAAGAAPPFNFLRPRITRWQRSFASMRQRGFLVRALAVAGALLVLCTAVFVLHAWRAASLERRWEGMREEVARVEGYEGDIRAWRDWHDASLPSLDLLKTVTEAFPATGEVTATALQIKEKSVVTCTGTARSTEAFRRFQSALGAKAGVGGLKVQQVRGEDPVQFSVTFNWNPRGGA